MAGKSLIGALRVTLGLDSAEFVKGGAKSRKELTAIQKGAIALKGALVGMIGFEVINQLRSATREAVDLAGAIGETAQQVGVSASELQKMRIVAIGAGIEQGKLEKNIAQLTKRLGAAQLGTKAQAAAFEEMGIKIKDAAGNMRTTEDVLMDIADAAKNSKNDAELHAMSSKLMGKGAQEMIPFLKLGADEIRRIGDEADRSGRILSDKMVAGADDLADRMADLEDEMKTRRAKLFLEDADAVMKFERHWAEFQIGLYKIGGAIGSMFSWIASASAKMNEFKIRVGIAINGTLAVIAALPGKTISAMRNMVTGVGRWLGKELVAIFDGVKKRVDAVGTWFYDLYDKVVGHSYIPDMVDEIGVHMARLDGEMVSPTVTATTKAAEAFRALQQEVSGILSRLFPEQAEANQFAAETKTLNDYFDALKKQGGDALQIERQREAAVEALRRAYLGLHRDLAGVEAGGSATLIEAVNGGKSIEEMNDEVSDRFADTMGKLKKQSDITKVQIVDSFAQMVDGGLRQLDRFMKGIKSGNFLDIVGGLFGAINGIAGAVTGGKGWNLGPFTFGSGSANVPGFANGGSMVLGGFRGIDRNMLSLNGSPIARVSESERLSITPANDRGGGGTKIFDMRGAVVTEDLLRQMNNMADDRVRVMAPGIARAGASMAIGQLRRSASRSLG